MAKIIECPRDAMQGLEQFVPTSAKIDYLNQLLKVNFDTLDFGSFVSPAAIPQMRDTAEVLANLTLDESDTRLLAIVANERGASEALSHKEISFLGYPFSISETFQQRNTRKSISQAVDLVRTLKEKADAASRELVVYLSMGFGNPYGDPYSTDIVHTYVALLAEMGIAIISLSDTIGSATPQQVGDLFFEITKQYPAVEFGVHLHATPAFAREKVLAAYGAGCRRFDGAIRGFGGCPMANDDLTGNVATEVIVSVLEQHDDLPDLNLAEFEKAVAASAAIF